MTTVTLHLMRHGEPVLAGRLLGRTDGAATAAGIDACRIAAEPMSFAGVIASDLQRARQCAEAIAADRGLAVGVDPRWRELDFGDWDGSAAADVDQAALARFWTDPDAFPPPGGERWSSIVTRVAAATAGLVDGSLVVTHAGAMRAALAALCDFGHRQAWALDLPYASVLSLRLWRGAEPSAQIIGLRA